MTVLLLLASLGWQDPFRVAPDEYRLLLENAYVRLVQVSYGPRQKSPVHDHPGLPTVYVYTTDGDKMRISHAGGPSVERPAVLAGQVRFNRGMPEHHTMENLGALPSQYIRVEMKTVPVDLPEKDVRLTPGDAAFENGMLRISRVSGTGAEALPTVYVEVGSGKTTFVPAGSEYTGAGRVVKVELKTAPK